MSRGAGDRSSLASALNTLGDLHRAERRFEESIAAYEEAMELDYALGNTEDGAVAFCNLGRAWICRGDLIRARAALPNLLDLAGEVGSKHVYSGVLDVATGFSLAHREWGLGTRLHGSCDALLEQSSLQRDVTDGLFLEPLIAEAREALGDAVYQTDYGAGRGISCEEAIAEMRAWLASHLDVAPKGPLHPER